MINEILNGIINLFAPYYSWFFIAMGVVAIIFIILLVKKLISKNLNSKLHKK